MILLGPCISFCHQLFIELSNVICFQLKALARNSIICFTLILTLHTSGVLSFSVIFSP